MYPFFFFFFKDNPVNPVDEMRNQQNLKVHNSSHTRTHTHRDVARNFEFRPFGPNSPKLLGPLKKIKPLYLVHLNTRTLYFYTQ